MPFLSNLKSSSSLDYDKTWIFFSFPHYPLLSYVLKLLYCSNFIIQLSHFFLSRFHQMILKLSVMDHAYFRFLKSILMSGNTLGSPPSWGARTIISLSLNRPCFAAHQKKKERKKKKRKIYTYC